MAIVASNPLPDLTPRAGDPPGLRAAKLRPAILAGVDADSLDETLPGVAALARHLRDLLDQHAHLRLNRYTVGADSDASLYDDFTRDINGLTTRILAVWNAAHLVTGAEQQARETASSTMRGFVVDADREARTSAPPRGAGHWSAPTYAAQDIEHRAHTRAAERMREAVGSLALYGTVDESKALP